MILSEGKVGFYFFHNKSAMINKFIKIYNGCDFNQSADKKFDMRFYINILKHCKK